MQYLGIEYSVKNMPELAPGFLPFGVWAAECRRVLREEYPVLFDQIHVMLPDGKTRRVGQGVAAASLPEG